MRSLTSDPAALESPTPFDVVATHVRATRRTKRELIAMSRDFEKQALSAGGTVLVTFQSREHLTDRSRESYAALAAGGAEVFAFAQKLVPDYRPETWALRTVALLSSDPLVHEWDIVVDSPTVKAAFVARDLTPGAAVQGRDLDRAFSWTHTDDPDLVEAAAASLLARVPAAAR